MSDAVFHIPSSGDAYRAALEGLARLDEYIIGTGVIPRLYDSGARYKKEPRDTWRHALDVSRQGWGDCEDLAGYRVGELRVSGEDPGATIDTYRTGPRRFHAIVRRTQGVIPDFAHSRLEGPFEDPSLALGMNPSSATVSYAALAEVPDAAQIIARGDTMKTACAVLGEDPTPSYRQISFDLIPLNRGWSGVVRIPLADGRAIVMRPSSSSNPKDAARKSVNLAKMASKHPAVAAAMPPQAQLAAKVLSNPAAGKAAASVLKVRKFL